MHEKLETYLYSNPAIQNNTIFEWFVICLIALIIAIVIKLLLSFVLKRLYKLAQKTHAVYDDIAIELINGLNFFVLWIWVFYLLTKSLHQNALQSTALLTLFVVASIIQVSVWGLHILKNWRSTVLHRKMQADPSSTGALSLLYRAAQTCFIITIVLIGLSNLNINVSALFASLGIGGIAIALAAQNILGDLFASVSIVLDKPFNVGDLIMVGTEKGTVEYIGIKTTRLRSVSGEELIISNKNLVESRVYNYKRIVKRCVTQKFAVSSETTLELVAQIPVWIKNIVNSKEKLSFLNRCHLVNYANSALNFELVFFVLDADTHVYMNLQQDVLLEILKKFETESIKFSLPLATLSR